MRPFPDKNYVDDIGVHETHNIHALFKRGSWSENTVNGNDYIGDPSAAYIGDTVTYTYDIYNSGTTTLSKLALTSAKVGCRI